MNLEKRIEQNQVESRILNMARAQAASNRYVAEAWQEHGTPWLSFVWLEASKILQEYVLSPARPLEAGWNHAGKEVLVNIWRYALSWCIENQKASDIADSMAKYVVEDMRIFNHMSWSADVGEWVDQLVSSATFSKDFSPYTPHFNVRAFYQLMKRLEMSFDDLERLHFSSKERAA